MQEKGSPISVVAVLRFQLSNTARSNNEEEGLDAVMSQHRDGRLQLIQRQGSCHSCISCRPYDGSIEVVTGALACQVTEGIGAFRCDGRVGLARKMIWLKRRAMLSDFLCFRSPFDFHVHHRLLYFLASRQTANGTLRHAPSTSHGALGCSVAPSPPMGRM